MVWSRAEVRPATEPWPSLARKVQPILDCGGFNAFACAASTAVALVGRHVDDGLAFSGPGSGGWAGPGAFGVLTSLTKALASVTASAEAAEMA